MSELIRKQSAARPQPGESPFGAHLLAYWEVHFPDSVSRLRQAKLLAKVATDRCTRAIDAVVTFGNGENITLAIDAAESDPLIGQAIELAPQIESGVLLNA